MAASIVLALGAVVHGAHGVRTTPNVLTTADVPLAIPQVAGYTAMPGDCG